MEEERRKWGVEMLGKERRRIERGRTQRKGKETREGMKKERKWEEN